MKVKEYKFTEEHRKRMSETHVGFSGKKHTAETKKKISLAGTGRYCSPETREKLRRAMLGKKRPESVVTMLRKRQLGKKLTEETKKKIGDAHRGEKSSSWKGGVSSINHIIRSSSEYRSWRTAVFERDNYTCVWCKLKGVRLQADHIKSFARYSELRFELSNGRTLCIPCHKTTDTFGSRSRSKHD